MVINYCTKPEARFHRMYLVPVRTSSSDHNNNNVLVVLLTELLSGIGNNASDFQLTAFYSAKVACCRNAEPHSVDGGDRELVSDGSRASQFLWLWSIVNLSTTKCRCSRISPKCTRIMFEVYHTD